VITVTQTCDGCGTERVLKVGYHGQPRAIRDAQDVGGWREVRVDQHLCPGCIARALPERDGGE
jgi:hypothetical protein